MAKYFSNVDEVELCLGYTFTPEQYELVGIYLFTGKRPEANGCWTCTEGYIRMITGEIDQYELAIERGEAIWPYQQQLHGMTPPELQSSE